MSFCLRCPCILYLIIYRVFQQKGKQQQIFTLLVPEVNNWTIGLSNITVQLYMWAISRKRCNNVAVFKFSVIHFCNDGDIIINNQMSLYTGVLQANHYFFCTLKWKDCHETNWNKVAITFNVFLCECMYVKQSHITRLRFKMKTVFWNIGFKSIKIRRSQDPPVIITDFLYL